MNHRIIALCSLLVASIICAPAAFGWAGNQGTQAIGDSPTSHAHAGASSGGSALTPLTLDVSSSAKMPAVTPTLERQIGFQNDVFAAYVGSSLKLYLYDLTGGTGILESGTGGTRTLAIDPTVVVTDPVAASTWATSPAAVSVLQADMVTASAQITINATCPQAVADLQSNMSTAQESISTHFAITIQNQADIDAGEAQLATERTTAGLVFSAVESVIVTNTAANCAITPTAAAGSQTLDAATVTTGTVLDIDLWCLLNSKGSAPGTLTAGLNFSGTPICTGQFTPGNGWTNRPMHLNYQVTVQAAGAGGYVIGYGDGTVAGVVTIAAVPTGFTTVAVDFSAAVNVIPAFQWQTADVDNSIVVQQFSIRRAR